MRRQLFDNYVLILTLLHMNSKYIKHIVIGFIFISEVHCASEHGYSPEDINWIVSHSSDILTFAKDTQVNASCNEDSTWSGNLTISPNDDTVLVSDYPSHGFSQDTTTFYTHFKSTWFPKHKGGYPYMVIYWNAQINDDINAFPMRVIEFTTGSNSPVDTVEFSVCGITLDEKTYGKHTVKNMWYPNPPTNNDTLISNQKNYHIFFYQAKSWDGWCSIDLSRCIW